MVEGKLDEGVPALLACRFLRDASFPDEKLSIERQFSAAVKGTLEAYRFFQSLPAETRRQMAETYERHPPADPLFRLFATLETEANPARASHMIRKTTARTHSYRHVRYPDTALAGKVVVVTGGGTGMGRSLALEAARRGGNVVITGRRHAPLLETKADMDDLIRHLGLTNQTLFVQGDVSDPKYVGEMFEQIEKEFGRIDVLYNNAGVSGPVVFGSAYEEGHFDEYREAVNVHLTGSWMASLEAARIMEEQPGGGTIVMVGTFYSESIHRHVLHAYPGRLPYTSAQSAKLALGDYLAWALAGKKITVLSLNPAAVSTERIQRGSGVFDKGSKARARIGRNVPPEALERDTLERTVGHAFVDPRDFAALALEVVEGPFRRTIGGSRLPMGGVTYEQPPGVLPSPAALSRYPDLVGKVALLVVGEALSADVPLVESSAAALARAGAAVILSGGRPEILEPIALKINARGGEGTATVSPVNLSHPAQVQELFDGLPRVDLLLYFTGSVDWKRPLTNLSHDEWTARLDRFGLIPRFLCWQAERRMDRDGTDGTIVLVGPDLSGVPTIRERNLVQVFQAMLRPAVATEAMERALMRKASVEGTSPGPVANVNIGLVLPGRTDGRNRQARPEATAASVLWFLDDGKRVSGAVLLPDEQNAIASLPLDPVEIPGTASGKVAVVTGGIRNLGKEISLRLAAERATVVIGSRYPPTGSKDPAEAEKARGELAAADAVLTRMRRSGGRALWVHTDVAQPGSVRALLSETRNRFGRVDLLVNNAGAGGNFSRVGDVMRDHRENFTAVLAANFLGPWEAIVAARGDPADPAGRRLDRQRLHPLRRSPVPLPDDLHGIEDPVEGAGEGRARRPGGRRDLHHRRRADAHRRSEDGVGDAELRDEVLRRVRRFPRPFPRGPQGADGGLPSVVRRRRFRRGAGSGLDIVPCLPPGAEDAEGRARADRIVVRQDRGVVPLHGSRGPAAERGGGGGGPFRRQGRAVPRKPVPRDHHPASLLLLSPVAGARQGPLRRRTGDDRVHRRRRSDAPPPARGALRNRSPRVVALRCGVARRPGADRPPRRASVREGDPWTGAGNAAARPGPVRSPRRRALAGQRARQRSSAGVRRPGHRRDGGGKRGPRRLRGRPPAVPRKNRESGHPVRRVRARGA